MKTVTLNESEISALVSVLKMELHRLEEEIKKTEDNLYAVNLNLGGLWPESDTYEEDRRYLIKRKELHMKFLRNCEQAKEKIMALLEKIR